MLLDDRRPVGLDVLEVVAAVSRSQRNTFSWR
jgi:hypothetical protein